MEWKRISGRIEAKKKGGPDGVAWRSLVASDETAMDKNRNTD